MPEVCRPGDAAASRQEAPPRSAPGSAAPAGACGSVTGRSSSWRARFALRFRRAARSWRRWSAARRRSRQAQGSRTAAAEFDEGLENLVAVPLVLLLSWWFCSSNFGRLLASLVGMPFHELGHAAGSWLSSRIAIPLAVLHVLVRRPVGADGLHRRRRARLAAVPHLPREELVHARQRVRGDAGLGRDHLPHLAEAHPDVADPLRRARRARLWRVHPHRLPLPAARPLALGLLAMGRADPGRALLHPGA